MNYIQIEVTRKIQIPKGNNCVLDGHRLCPYIGTRYINHRTMKVGLCCKIFDNIFLIRRKDTGDQKRNFFKCHECREASKNGKVLENER